MEYVLILLLILVLIYFNFKDNFTPIESCCILLTTTVFINTNNDFDSPKNRLKIYIDTINDYLNFTDLIIYVVESSDYIFPEFKDNPRVKVYAFKPDNDIICNRCWATPYEAESIKRAFNYFGLIKYERLIKITGKYFIPDIDNLIKNIPPNADIFFQNSNENNLYKQNSEIFGCKTEYLNDIMDKIIENSKNNMNFESTLYTLNTLYIIYTFPPIKLTKPVKRSGDNKILTVL